MTDDGAPHFDRLRGNDHVRAFLDGAGPAAIGAIFGSAIPLAITLAQPWQFAVLGGAAIPLLVLRRGVVTSLLVAATTGALLAVAGIGVPRRPRPVPAESSVAPAGRHPFRTTIRCSRSIRAGSTFPGRTAFTMLGGGDRERRRT